MMSKMSRTVTARVQAVRPRLEVVRHPQVDLLLQAEVHLALHPHQVVARLQEVLQAHPVDRVRPVAQHQALRLARPLLLAVARRHRAALLPVQPLTLGAVRRRRAVPLLLVHPRLGVAQHRVVLPVQQVDRVPPVVLRQVQHLPLVVVPIQPAVQHLEALLVQLLIQEAVLHQEVRLILAVVLLLLEVALALPVDQIREVVRILDQVVDLVRLVVQDQQVDQHQEKILMLIW